MKSFLIILTCIGFVRNSLVAQTAYPPRVVQNQAWSNTTHRISVPQSIISPGTAGASMNISNTAQVHFESGNAINLRDGFHAGGLYGPGYFRASIKNNLNLEMFLVSSDPPTPIIDNIVHVNRWEKFEIAFKLPPDYETAIENFLDHYYDNIPNNVTPSTDLNPYADDSIQVEVKIKSPSGYEYTRYAFYMKEAKWDENPQLCQLGAGKLEANNGHPLALHHWHFRFAPDKSYTYTPWTFSIKIQSEILPTYEFKNFMFMCDPALPDNKGYLQVSPVNNRYLKFMNGEAFFPIGENIAGPRHSFADPSCFEWNGFYKRDMDKILESFEELNSVGANFVRLSMSKDVFSPEWENLGVYDLYGHELATSCAGAARVPNPHLANSNRQFNCWALDQVFKKARAENIYLQLNVIRDFPVNAYAFPGSTAGWGCNAYVQKFSYEPTSPLYQGPYDFSKYFVSEDFTDPDWFENLDGGSFYYWKRFYKYFMSRWGYSTNLAMIETFNEIDGILGYNAEMPNNTHCSNNLIPYPVANKQPIRDAIVAWHKAMIPYIKNELDENRFGGFNHLVTASYLGGVDVLNANPPAPSDFDLFYDPDIDVDIMDFHSYIEEQHMNENRWRVTNHYVYNIANLNATSLPLDKPFQFGECSTLGPVVLVENPISGLQENNSLTTLFDNYETTFHNMLWATAFNGNLQPGQTWQYEIVHWWPEAMGRPVPDNFNLNPSNNLDVPNIIRPSGLTTFPLANKKIFSHYQPLVNFFKPASQGGSGIDLVNDVLIPKFIYSDATYQAADFIECYYLVKDNGGGYGNHAYGWLHNQEKTWENHRYYKDNDEDYFACLENIHSPSSTFKLSGLDMNISNYDITFFPTYSSGQNLPTAVCSTDIANNVVTVTLNTNLLGCGPLQISEFVTTAADADVAFDIHPAGQLRLSQSSIDTKSFDSGLKFAIYPNPTNGELSVSINEINEEYRVIIYDLTSRLIFNQTLTNAEFKLDLKHYPKGVYFIKISTESKYDVRKLIIQ